jgi:transcriptional regulator with XRE-family HTH domain
MPKSVFTEEYAALLATLVSARKAAQMTQAELSARIGRPQPFISYVERGERRVDVVEFYAIALALGRDPIELFAEVVRQFPNNGRPQV